MKRFIYLFVKLLTMPFTNIILTHLKALLCQVDPLLPVEVDTYLYLNKMFKCKHFLFPCCFDFIYRNLPKFRITLQGNWKCFILEKLFNPYVFSHQIVSVDVWKQFDFVLFCDTITTMIIFITLATTKEVKKQFQFFIVTTNVNRDNVIFENQKQQQVIINKQILTKNETTKMFFVQRLVWKTLSTLLTGFYIFVFVFFYSNVWLNDVYELSINSIVYWTTIFPFYFAYIIYSNFYKKN